MLSIGDPLPWFKAASSVNDEFRFDQLAGRRVVVVFLASLGLSPARALWTGLTSIRSDLRRRGVTVVGVSNDPNDRDRYRQLTPTGRPIMFWDSGLVMARLFKIARPDPAQPKHHKLVPAIYLLDHGLRVIRALAISELGWSHERVVAEINTAWPANRPSAQAGIAPVLTIPNVLDEATCGRLIELWRRDNGVSGVMLKDRDGKLYGVIDGRGKRRRDHFVDRRSNFYRELSIIMTRRVTPIVRRAFHYDITRVERFVVAQYDGADHGFFSAHRDFVGSDSHRAFAMTLNLNADDYIGGALRFPEYGSRLYKPGTGEAIVFSGCLLHEALPVTQGCRFALLSFFYGEREAAVLQEYFRHHGRAHRTMDVRNEPLDARREVLTA